MAVTLRVDLRFSSRLSGRPSFCFFFARSLQRCCSDRRPASPHRSKSESQRQSPRTKIAKTANILSWQCDVRERGGASRNDTTRGHEHAGPIGAGPSTARNGGLITHSAPSISFIAVYGFFFVPIRPQPPTCRPKATIRGWTSTIIADFEAFSQSRPCRPVSTRTLSKPHQRRHALA